MWDDSRVALEPLELGSATRVLDVGAGTGALTQVLREESAGEVVAVDVNAGLLAQAGSPRVRGAATRLPFPDDSFDAVICQALLVNLPLPAVALREFARVSRGRVAAIEPDNGAVAIESTVDREAPLARRARDRYLAGVQTDATLGAARELFREAGLGGVTVGRYNHQQTVEPPYDEYAIESARRKASGEGLDSDRETMLAGATTPEEFGRLRKEWRAMGRTVVEQMQEGKYHQREVVPFYVTVGHVARDI